MDGNEKRLVYELVSKLGVEVLEVGHMRCPPTWRDMCYTPDFNKIYLIEDGEGMVEIAGREYFPSPGELYLLPRGVVQSYSYRDPRNTFLKHWVHFRASVGDVNLFDLLETPLWLRVKDFARMQGLFARLGEAFRSPSPACALAVKAAMYEIIRAFLEEAGEEAVSLRQSGETATLRSALGYIEQHLGETITVRQLAAQSFLHPNYFIRLFKNRMGESPIQFITKKRMERAKFLLENTGLPVREVAARTGFQSASYFLGVFKRNLGVTPTEYRMMRAGQEKRE